MKACWVILFSVWLVTRRADAGGRPSRPPPAAGSRCRHTSAYIARSVPSIGRPRAVCRRRDGRPAPARRRSQLSPLSGRALQTAFALPDGAAGTVATVVAPWLLRLGAGAAAYVGCVAACDRPRGELWVREGEDVLVRPSTVPGAGVGLFAGTDLPRGRALGTYPGVLLPLPANLGKLRRHPACAAYVWRFRDDRYVLDPTDARGALAPVCAGGSAGQYLSVWLFQATPLGALWRVSTALCRINESPRGRDVNVVAEEHTRERYVLFRLDRDVRAGEELFVDYGPSYDRSDYGLIDDGS